MSPRHRAIVDTLDNYLKELRSLGAEDLVLYRGQREDKPLLPKIGRGKVIPKTPESEMLASFKRQCVPYVPVPPLNEWDWLALAQHYGMATRLIDWTTNPLVALWFAVSEPPVGTHDGVVWTFRPKKLETIDIEKHKDGPFNLSAPAYFEPSHVSPRIRAQAGCFTAQPEVAKPLERTNGITNRITGIKIKHDSFWRLRYQLDLYGINAAVLFPDLDGLCRHITWNTSLLSDEEKHLERGTDGIWKVKSMHP